jgi:RNA polymerase sigma-70 factor (ECF subfamily)
MSQPPDPVSPELAHTVARCAHMVRRVGARHGLASADVDELFQEVRLRLWKSLSSGEKIGAAPASYVYRTAQSAAVDLIRRRRARREEAVDLTRPSGEQVLGSNPGPDAAVERGELIEAVGRAVDALAETRRPVVRMYLTGYTLQEITTLLGWTEPKTRNLLYRGLADLRAALREQGIGPEAAE